MSGKAEYLKHYPNQMWLAESNPSYSEVPFVRAVAWEAWAYGLIKIETMIDEERRRQASV